VHQSDPASSQHPAPSKRAGRVLIVDDIEGNIILLRDLLEPEGYEVVSAPCGTVALERVAAHRPDVVLCDIRMPDQTGFEVCRALKADPVTRLIPVVLMTALSEQDDRVRALDAGADDFLAKPFDPTELAARVRSLMRLKRFTDDLDSAETVLRSLAQMIELRDLYTRGHCERLAAYATLLGAELHLGDEDISALHRGGYFHDIGKIGIPDAILLKPSALTSDEYTRMKEHTVIGDQLCGQLRTLSTVRSIVRSHHERLDGSGYPDGLRGEEVPLLAQIIGIVDVYDAITTARPYKPALTPEDACEQLREEARRGWRDAGIVDVFVAAALNQQLGVAQSAS
jgi:putative two-component system response regulator